MGPCTIQEALSIRLGTAPSGPAFQVYGGEMSKIYFSVDIETDGVVAGRNNMLSLGAAALDMHTGKIVATFKQNLQMVNDLEPDADTMQWWKNYPEAFDKAREYANSPEHVMWEFVQWVQLWQQNDSIIFAWKPVMDLAFVRYYIHRFHPNGEKLCIKSIFARQGFGLDQKTVAAIALHQSYRKTKMDSLPQSLRLDEEGKVMMNHSHDALEDAIEQAHIFWNSVRKLGVEL
jgi:DNA polymerase III alpha subunit (gram-positive type)